MKKKYKKLMLFLSLCLSLFICLTVSSHAYYYDSNTGNIESSNLYNVGVYTDSNLTFDIDTGSVSTINDSSSAWSFIAYSIESYTTYTISFTSLYHCWFVYSRDNNSLYNVRITPGSHTITFTSDSNYIRFYYNWASEFYYRLSLSSLMLVNGSSAIPFEPYGVLFYSQSNYNDYGENRYSVGFSDALQYDSVSPVSMENLSECTYYVNGVTGSSSGWFERTFIVNGSLDDSSFASESDGFNTSYGLFSGSQSFVDFVLDDYGIHLTSETPSELGQESYIEFVLSRTYSSDNFSCTLGLAFTHLDCFNFSGSLVYSFVNDQSSIVNRNYVLSNIPLSNISVFKLYFDQDTVLDESPVFLNISPLESAFNSGYLKGISDNSVNYEYGKQKYKEGYNQGKLDTQNSSVVSNSNFQKLIWTIGATPFESFKTIWDVDVMGLNISGIILGGLMALLVLYLIKKIWK